MKEKTINKLGGAVMIATGTTAFLLTLLSFKWDYLWNIALGTLVIGLLSVGIIFNLRGEE